jgi:hypothetical protein
MATCGLTSPQKYVRAFCSSISNKMVSIIIMVCGNKGILAVYFWSPPSTPICMWVEVDIACLNSVLSCALQFANPHQRCSNVKILCPSDRTASTCTVMQGILSLGMSLPASPRCQNIDLPINDLHWQASNIFRYRPLTCLKETAVLLTVTIPLCMLRKCCSLAPVCCIHSCVGITNTCFPCHEEAVSVSQSHLQLGT